MITIKNMCCITGSEQFLEDDSVDLIVTDPPFNLGFGGTTQTRTKKPRFHIIENDKLSFRDYQRFSLQWLRQAYRILKPKHHIYVCIDWRMYPFLFRWMQRVGFHIKNLVVWDKVNFGMGWQYRFQHELVIFAVKGAHKVRRVSTRNTPDIWKIKRIPGNQTCHPTEKPTELFEMMIQNSSQSGELVVDFFTGIGASMEAAFNLNRDFYGFEIDTGYYNDIMERYNRIHT